MSIVVDWLDADKKIIYYDFPAQWTWDDLYSAMTQVKDMMATVPYNVYVVIDYEKSQGMPPGALTQLRVGTMKASPNWGGGVFIGVSALVKTLLNTFTTINKRLGERYSIAKDREEALAIIDKWRENEAQRLT